MCTQVEAADITCPARKQRQGAVQMCVETVRRFPFAVAAALLTCDTSCVLRVKHSLSLRVLRSEEQQAASKQLPNYLKGRFEIWVEQIIRARPKRAG